MNNLDLLSDDNIAQDRKEGKHGRHCCLSVDDQERDMVDFQAIRQVVDTRAAFISVCYYYNLVASIDQFRRELVNVTFDSARLGEEEVADHGNVVRHAEQIWTVSQISRGLRLDESVNNMVLPAPSEHS